MQRLAHVLPASLSPEVCRSLELLASGLLTDEVAARLGVERSTVRRHVVEAIAILGARSKLEAVVLALRSGLIGLPVADSGPLRRPHDRGRTTTC